MFRPLGLASRVAPKPVSSLQLPFTLARPAASKVPDFRYEPMFDTGEDKTQYRKITGDHVETVECAGQKILRVAPEGLRLLASEGMKDIAHLLRPGHLQQLRNIWDDPEATKNDKFVALELLKNANIASGMVLPGCQDTGTAIVMGKKGQYVWTDGNDEEMISRGVFDTYVNSNLRYSQNAPLDMFKEVNTGSNLPAQIDIYAKQGNSYDFMFMAKGGGSANKTFLYQETKAVLNPTSLMEFVDAKIKTIGTSACPPYHLALVIGGTSAEATLKTVKLASARYLDGLPTSGSPGGRAFRDLEYEAAIHELTMKMGIGAQFGGKYFCHDVRVIRLPRHGASCPIGLGVSCSADRQALGKITTDGIFLEALERDPAQYLPVLEGAGVTVKVKGGEKVTASDEVVAIDLRENMSEIRQKLSQFPITTRVSLTGPLVVARDIAHAKLKERLDAGQELPQYMKDHMVYYAGPAKTPDGLPSGSFGPTTAGRMDAYVPTFMAAGGSFITLAKGNRSRQVTKACHEHGGFYLGSIGGPAAVLAQDCIRSVEVLEYEELGMEAIFKIEVENFPAFIIVDDKGNDFFSALL